MIAAVLIRLPLSTLCSAELAKHICGELASCRTCVSVTWGPSMDEPHRSSGADERLSHHSHGALCNPHCHPGRVTEEGEIRPALIYSPPETQSEPWRVNPIQAGPAWTLSFTDTPHTTAEVSGKFLMGVWNFPLGFLSHIQYEGK